MGAAILLGIRWKTEEQAGVTRISGACDSKTYYVTQEIYPHPDPQPRHMTLDEIIEQGIAPRFAMECLQLKIDSANAEHKLAGAVISNEVPEPKVAASEQN